MTIEHTELAHGAFPAATNLPANSDSVSAWANGAWRQIEASAASDRIVTGLCYRVGNSGYGEFDLGVGAAGSEVVKGTIHYQNRGNRSNTQQWLQIPVPGSWISSGDRVAWRVRHGVFDLSAAYGLAYTAYSDTPADATVTANVLKVSPSASVGLSVTPSGTAWANGAWAELVAATSAGWVLGHLVSRQSANSACVAVEFDIGVGAAGSEVVVATFRYSGDNSGLPSVALLSIPTTAIASGVRVAIRCRQDGTLTSAWDVAVAYQEQPL